MKSAIAIASLLLGTAGHAAAAQAPTSVTRDLMDQSDFVGFFLAWPMLTSGTGEWRQFYSPSAYPASVEPIKGSLPSGPAGNSYPSIAFDHHPATGYPTALAPHGDGLIFEYLVFLKRGVREAKPSWNTIAAFPVLYRPDANGNVAGSIFGDEEERFGVPKDQIRSILKGMLDRTGTATDVQPLDTVLRSAIAAAARPEYRQPVPHEKRLADVQRLVASIKPGTSRTDVEKILTTENGGLSSESTYYFMGSEVMVEVPYDRTGGTIHLPENKVRGPIRVYRGQFFAG